MIGVRKVTDEEKMDCNLFWYKNDEDIVHRGLNIKFVKAFLAHSKIKANGKMCSNSNLRKYKDAIVWGSSKAKQPLPSSFYNDIDKFLKLFKKETKKAAKDGLLDEHEADPISWTLFNFILQCAL